MIIFIAWKRLIEFPGPNTNIILQSGQLAFDELFNRNLLVLHVLYTTMGYINTGSRHIDCSDTVTREMRQAHKSKQSLGFKSHFRFISGKETEAIPFAELD